MANRDNRDASPVPANRLARFVGRSRYCSSSLSAGIAAFLIGGWLGLAVGQTPAAPADRPNIILVLADDLGINDLGCYGRREHRTAQLDKLAAEGLRFTSAYAAQPICSPARAALLTGKCPARLQLTSFLPGRPDAPSQPLLQPVIAGQLPLEERTLAELLRSSGYRTGIFGKWHLGGPGFGPLEQGFDVEFSPPATSQPSDQEGGKSESAITRAAMDFIEANRGSPFFCFVAHHTPHVPLLARPELVARYAASFQPTYAAMLETFDDAVGKLLDKIEELGLEERTIFIVTSDNGGLHVLELPGTPATHNTPFRAGKGFLYEGGLRVPLLVRWPGTVPADRVVDAPVVLTDLLPTLLEAAGIDPAKSVGPLDGTSLLGLWRGERLPDRPLFWHFPHYSNQGGRPAGAIRSGDWKLVESFEDGGLELYNLAEDVGEVRNLAAAEPARADQMQRQLAEWRRRVGAQLPTVNPDCDPGLHRQLYLERDPSRTALRLTAAELEAEWAGWRELMNAAVAGRTPRGTRADGELRLEAKAAIVHGEVLRYEPEAHKDVLGYWTKVSDWAEWRFAVPQAGIYEIEVLQGCGDGSGGAEVEVVAGGQSLRFTVLETGHFQQLIRRAIGEVELAAGEQALAIRPRTKPGAAVMDVRRVVLRPK